MWMRKLGTPIWPQKNGQHPEPYLNPLILALKNHGTNQVLCGPNSSTHSSRCPPSQRVHLNGQKASRPGQVTFIITPLASMSMQIYIYIYIHTVHDVFLYMYSKSPVGHSLPPQPVPPFRGLRLTSQARNSYPRRTFVPQRGGRRALTAQKHQKTARIYGWLTLTLKNKELLSNNSGKDWKLPKAVVSLPRVNRLIMRMIMWNVDTRVCMPLKMIEHDWASRPLNDFPFFQPDFCHLSRPGGTWTPRATALEHQDSPFVVAKVHHLWGGLKPKNTGSWHTGAEPQSQHLVWNVTWWHPWRCRAWCSRDTSDINIELIGIYIYVQT